MLTSAWLLLDNFLAEHGVRELMGSRQEHLSGQSIDDDIAYAAGVVRNYANHGVTTGRVAEIGPGGSAATALLMMDQGAESVELLDRFTYPHEQALLDRTYAAVICGSPKLQQLFPDPTDLSDHIRFETGEAAAAERYFEDHTGFDAVCSCAVFEHLSDPIAALNGITRALKPGGKQVHYIDFRDHGTYTAGGFHELTFLKIPGWLYPYMSRARGRPNRVLTGQYRAACDSLGVNYEILVTTLVGVGPVGELPYEAISPKLRQTAEKRVSEIRSQLAEPFRSMTLADLAIDGIALIAKKPG